MTLVLLHPLPLDGSIWADDLRSLCPHWIAPTLYGLGDSLGDWATGVLDLCDDGPLVLVGSSIGGSCAIEIARLAPDRVRLIVLVGAKAGHRPEPAFRDEALRVLEHEGLDIAWHRYWAPLFAPTAEQEVVAHARAVAHRQGVEAIARGVRVFHGRPDRAAFASTLDVPVVVVSGEHDTAPANPGAVVAGLRRGELHRVEGSGHYVPVERPGQLTSIVRTALARVNQRPGPTIGSASRRVVGPGH